MDNVILCSSCNQPINCINNEICHYTGSPLCAMGSRGDESSSRGESSSWNVPADVYLMPITIMGGGGAGASCQANSSGGTLPSDGLQAPQRYTFCNKCKSTVACNAQNRCIEHNCALNLDSVIDTEIDRATKYYRLGFELGLKLGQKRDT